MAKLFCLAKAKFARKLDDVQELLLLLYVVKTCESSVLPKIMGQIVTVMYPLTGM